MTCIAMPHPKRNPAWPMLRQRLGFSLTEMVVTISVLGIVATIALISLNGMFEASVETVARERLETLNSALHKFSTSNYDLTFTAQPASGADELYVLRSLQYRNPNPLLAKVGSPYVPQFYNPTVSSDSNDHRMRWTGKLYELLRPGQAGTGLKIAFDNSDMSGDFEFPPNFQMAGR